MADSMWTGAQRSGSHRHWGRLRSSTPEGDVGMAKRGQAVIDRVPLFDGLTKGQLRQIRDLTEEVRYMPGASIVREGSPGDSFYVIVEGEAKVQRRGRTLAKLLPGDFFGEISLLDGSERTATVVSGTSMLLLELKQRPFLKMLERQPDVSLKMMRGLASRLREMERPLAG
jgi:CRP/FNR family cyclic AMP-dependent transcriptional regulator